MGRILLVISEGRNRRILQVIIEGRMGRILQVIIEKIWKEGKNFTGNW